MNKFMLNETSYHGAGAINAIPDEVKSRGFKKVFVASDPDLVKFGVTGIDTARTTFAVTWTISSSEVKLASVIPKEEAENPNPDICTARKPQASAMRADSASYTPGHASALRSSNICFS